MVKINTATYAPRFRVGAISEVTARAVSSLIPAPTPARAMPPDSLSASDPGRINLLSQLTNEYIHGIRSRGHDHAEDNEESTSQGNISTAHQIRERSNKRADSPQGQKIGQDLVQVSRKKFVRARSHSQTKSIYPHLQCLQKCKEERRLFTPLIQCPTNVESATVELAYQRCRGGFGSQSRGKPLRPKT